MLQKQYFTLKKHIPSISSQICCHVVRESILLPIIIIFLITFLLITPQGEFALNDDWIHAKAVQRLLEEGHYRGHPYVAATLVAQAYWGALFCKFLGFSFTTLRISTLVLAITGAWAVAKSALVLGIKRNLALLCGILFAFNPIILSLSYSFMTDVPFLSLSALSGLCFLSFFRRGNAYLVALGSSFAVIGFFVRQFAIVPPVVFAGTLAVLWWRSQHRVKWSTIAALLGPWSAGAAVYSWLLSIKENGTPLFLAGKTIPVMAIETIRHYPIALCYLGLFALPLGAGIVWQIQQKDIPWKRQQSIGLASISSLCLAIFALPRLLNNLRAIRVGSRADWLDTYRYRLPLLSDDYLRDLALGNPQLPDQYPHPLIHLQAGWWIFTIAALITAGLCCIFSYQLVQRIWKARTPAAQVSVEDHQRLFLLIWLLLGLGIVYNPWRLAVFDRLLLGGFEPFLLLLAIEMNRYRQRVPLKIVAVGTVVIYCFSVTGLQDYLAWNRTAWQAENQLIQTDHVSSETIRGVDPFNGWYNSDRYMQVYRTKDFWQAAIAGHGPWAFDDTYVVTSEESRDGYHPIKTFSYFTWLGMQNRLITVFRRTDPHDHQQNQPRNPNHQGKESLQQNQSHPRSGNHRLSSAGHLQLGKN